MAAKDGGSGELILDAGDLFFDRYRVGKPHSKVARATAAFIVQMYGRIGCDGITLGDRDLLLGRAELTRLHALASFPFLVANLVDRKSGAPIFDTDRIEEVAGVKVGLFGVTLPRPRGDGGRSADGWKIRDPVATARWEVRSLRRRGAQVIVALAHLRGRQEERLADKVHGIDVILGGQDTTFQQAPEHEGDSFIASGFMRGKYLSIMTLNIWRDRLAKAKHPGPLGPFAEHVDQRARKRRLVALDARIDGYRRFITDAAKRAPETVKPAGAGAKQRAALRSRVAANLQFYRAQIVRLKAKREMLSLQLRQPPGRGADQNFITYEMVPVVKSIMPDPAIAKAVRAFRAKYPKRH